MLASVVLTSSDEFLQAELRLNAMSVLAPLTASSGWARHIGKADHRSILAFNAEGLPVGILGIMTSPTRAIPGHKVLRIKAVDESHAGAVGHALLRAARDYAAAEGRVISLTVDLECLDTEIMHSLQNVLTSLGFRRVPAERVSERTLIVDLLPPEPEVLESFSRRAKQNLRASAKHGLEVRALTDAQYAQRLDVLLNASLARTGGAHQHIDWNSVLALSLELPSSSRLAGVFEGPCENPETLLGFAWGMRHSRRLEYSSGGSVRLPGANIPVLYSALWDLMMWGKSTGSEYFDLGGVTVESNENSLGGISHFKRAFSKTEVEFGQEWRFVPSPSKAAFADSISLIAKHLRAYRGAA